MSNRVETRTNHAKRRAIVPRVASLLLVAASLVALCACAGGRYPPVPASTGGAGETAPYIIGPLDVLNIVVWRNADLSSAVIVRPDGKISTPLGGEIQAAGLSPAQLSAQLETTLGKYIQSAKVSVMVSGFQGVYSQQIRIVGEAAKTQSVPYRQDMTVLDVMIQVGGITDFADGNAAVLVRGKEGKQYSLRLGDLLKRGDISANAEVRPGDIIIIPQSWF